MIDALTEVIDGFNAQGEHRAVASFASSSILAKQIEAGAPADIYLAASDAWMSYVVDRDLTREHQDLVGNTLVLIVPGQSNTPLALSSETDLVSALDGRRIAIGDPDHVPAGQYTKAALEHLGQWSTVAPHLARAKDVRAALAYVERGESPYGFVYATDAAASTRVTIAAVVPPDSHPPVTYPVARLTDDEAARAFYDYLTSSTGIGVFERHGFSRP
jgi:molybdate transport system substrate-binding protein